MFVMYVLCRSIPTLASTWSSSWPARPTKGRPCSSSSAPGASPISMRSASGSPSANTRFADSSKSSGGRFSASFSRSVSVTQASVLHVGLGLPVGPVQSGALAPHLTPDLGLQVDHQEEVLEGVLPALDLDVAVLGCAGHEGQLPVPAQRLAQHLCRRLGRSDFCQVRVHLAARFGMAGEPVR